MGNKSSNDKAAHQLREGFNKMGDGLKQGIQFVGEQAKHPAVQQFAKDTAQIVASSNGNPEEMAMKLGQRAGKEQNRIINRTIDHYTGHETQGNKSIPPVMNALTFI